MRALLVELQGRGLLEDGVEHLLVEPTRSPETPLDVLPGFGLHCDATGGCCAMYGSVIFTPAEAARARALVPQVLGAGDREDRAFLPDHGVRGAALAVALVDGRCAYLGESGRCSIHEAGGLAAKPRPCRTYPATFVDDGEAVRVSVGAECACVLASVGRPGGAPLVGDAMKVRADLEPGTHVIHLSERIAIRAGLSAPRAAFVAWSRRLLACPEPADPLAAFWALAAAVTPDLTPELAARALETATAPPEEELAPYIEALAARASARVAGAEAWRSVKDCARVTSYWLAEATESLRDAAGLRAAMEGPRPVASESFYFRATLHGHHLADEVPLERALRDRAVRLVVARALGAVIARHAPGDPSAAHPLALVEGMMRAHGLKAYAREIPVP